MPLTTGTISTDLRVTVWNIRYVIKTPLVVLFFMNGLPCHEGDGRWERDNVHGYTTAPDCKNTTTIPLYNTLLIHILLLTLLHLLYYIPTYSTTLIIL